MSDYLARLVERNVNPGRTVHPGAEVHPRLPALFEPPTGSGRRGSPLVTPPQPSAAEGEEHLPARPAASRAATPSPASSPRDDSDASRAPARPRPSSPTAFEHDEPTVVPPSAGVSNRPFRLSAPPTRSTRDETPAERPPFESRVLDALAALRSARSHTEAEVNVWTDRTVRGGTLVPRVEDETERAPESERAATTAQGESALLGRARGGGPEHRVSLDMRPYVTPAVRQEAAQAKGATAPVVRVTIGRIEVRGIMPSPPAPRAIPGTRGPALTLEEYLRQRSEGRR